ncbi:MAG: GNAT family N-acetyltransferase [Rhodobacteraceae bacterium]|nr:GNAT family N-acetyltransferase [Paracoccaceae bacterium]
MTPNTGLVLWDVTEDDVESICEIYRDEVLNGVSSWEEVPPSQDEMIRRCNTIVMGGYPYRVAEQNGNIAGYTYASPYRPRSGYRYLVVSDVSAYGSK